MPAPRFPSQLPALTKGKRGPRFETEDEAEVEEPTVVEPVEDPEKAESVASTTPETPAVEEKPTHKKGSAQHIVAEYWKTYKKGRKGQPSVVLPYNPYVVKKYGTTLPTLATESYNEAAAACKTKVERIVKECRQQNERYRDHYFDLKGDWLANQDYILEDDKILRYCLDGLKYTDSLKPGAAKRVTEIFDDPVFFKDGATAGDIKQGANGDCWFLAAVATITNVPSLIEKVVVARDEEVGVYGFVFYRDGEWISSVIDDQLFLSLPEFTSALEVRGAIGYTVKEDTYNKTFLKGSEALYFGKCADTNETWLPLLEKAFAKAHNDYASIEGGWTGEAVEDLTGGVTTEVFTADILSRDKFWNEEMLNVNKTILLAAAISSTTGAAVDGIFSGHAYSVLKAVETDGKRLVLVRNPWGNSEYTGPWSDGSKEWTSEWITKLEHTFGDDGSFWMEYRNFLRIFTELDRTRLFDETWNVSTAWVSEAVEWENTYSKNRFQLTVTEKGKYVIVLQKLDDRYFQGLEGEYDFLLYFRLHKQGDTDYHVRSKSNVTMSRSVSVEVELEEGIWDVAYKITAEKSKDTNRKPVEEVVQTVSMKNRKKFLQLGMSYDLAHAKGKPSKDKVVDDNEKEAKLEQAEAAAEEEADEAEAIKKETAKDEVADGETVEVIVGSGETKEKEEKKPVKKEDEKKPETKKDEGKHVTHDGEEAAGAAKTEDTAEEKKPVEKKEEKKMEEKKIKEEAEKEEADEKKSDDKPKKKKPKKVQRYVLVPEEDAELSEEEESEALWNAFAVVGLRVYTQNKGLLIEVIRPMKKKLLLEPDDASKQDGEEKKEGGEEKKNDGEETTKDGVSTEESKIEEEAKEKTSSDDTKPAETTADAKPIDEAKEGTTSTAVAAKDTAEGTTEDKAELGGPLEPASKKSDESAAEGKTTDPELANVKTELSDEKTKEPETDTERAIAENAK